MPLAKARKGMSKKSRQKVVSKVMHQLNRPGEKQRSQKQKVAIALSQAGLARRK